MTELAVVESTPMAMLERAVSSGASVEVMEKLLALQERWQAGQARRAYAEAMAGLRGALPEIVKTQTVDFETAKGRTNYKHEDLATIIGAISGPMADHGLSFRFRTEQPGGQTVVVTCITEHADGHYEETTLSAPIDVSGNKNAIQAIGSTVSYLQRYTLKAAIGLAAANDDDGRQGARPGEPPRGRPPEPQAPVPPPVPPPGPPPEKVMTPKQVAKWSGRIDSLIQAYGEVSVERAIKRTSEITIDEARATTTVSDARSIWESTVEELRASTVVDPIYEIEEMERRLLPDWKIAERRMEFLGTTELDFCLGLADYKAALEARMEVMEDSERGEIDGPADAA